MRNLNIVTLKWGRRYGVNCVNSLYQASQLYAPQGTQFHCFTNDIEGLVDGIQCHPLPDIELPEKYQWTFWRKISLFSPQFPLAEQCLYLDVDTCMRGSLEPLLREWNGKPRFIKNWVGRKTAAKPKYDRINSSVMLYNPAKCTEVWKKFHSNPTGVIASYPGDQGFVYDSLADQAEFFDAGLCVSFKKHCLARFPLNLILKPSPPKKSIIVCFHGKPDPEEALTGYWQGPWKHRCKPTPWALGTTVKHL